jgi:hypothetical protein
MTTIVTVAEMRRLVEQRNFLLDECDRKDALVLRLRERIDVLNTRLFDAEIALHEAEDRRDKGIDNAQREVIRIERDYERHEKDLDRRLREMHRRVVYYQARACRLAAQRLYWKNKAKQAHEAMLQTRRDAYQRTREEHDGDVDGPGIASDHVLLVRDQPGSP